MERKLWTVKVEVVGKQAEETQPKVKTQHIHFKTKILCFLVIILILIKEMSIFTLNKGKI